MGCVPSTEAGEVRTRGGAFFGVGSDDDDLTATSADYSASGRTGSCPHLMKSTGTLETTMSSSRFDSSHRLDPDETETETADPDDPEASGQKKKSPPGFISVLLQTILLFAILGGVVFLMVKYFPVEQVEKLYGYLKEVPAAAEALYEDIKKALAEFDYGSLIRWPLEWNDDADTAEKWNEKLKMESYVGVFTLGTFVVDLLTSSEDRRGHWLMLVPVLGYCLVFGRISLHAQATGLLNLDTLKSFDTVKIGETIFSKPQIVVMGFAHYFALNLALAFVMMKDFYSKVASRRILYKLLMAVVIVATASQGIITIPVYLGLRYLLFSGASIQKPKNMPLGRNSHRREFNYLLDPVPKGDAMLSVWVSTIPAPFDLPFYVVAVGLGTIRFCLSLVNYFVFTVFFCLPFSTLFYSLPRAWSNSRGKGHKGALYGPFERVDGKIFPPKALVAVSGHLRLMCLKRSNSFLFNITIGWWLRPTLAVWVLYEFIIFPFEFDCSPYGDFLMEEFGPIFPMGEGIGIGKHADAKKIIENPDLRKGDISLAWAASSEQSAWSKNNLVLHPKKEIDKALVDEGRQIARAWLRDVSKDLKNPLTRKRLDAILPFTPVDGTMLEMKQIQIAWASTVFHLLTGGELTEHERQSWWFASFKNVFPFMSDNMNKVWFGGVLSHTGMAVYDIIRHAFLRYLEAPALQRALALPEQNKWDAWTPPEVVRFLVYKYVTASGVAPSEMLSNIVQVLYDDPSLVEKYKENKRKFCFEVMRMGFGVPLINFQAHNMGTVKIFGQDVEIPEGTHIHVSIMNVNRDVDAFGPDAGVYNFDRPDDVLGKMLTFNGNQHDIAEAIKRGEHNYPPRRCVGYGYAMDMMEFLVDRFAPQDPFVTVSDYITEERFDEIKGNQTLFMNSSLLVSSKIYVMNNKYFPHASEVKHPLDTKGMSLGKIEVSLCGRTRVLPENDEDVGSFDTVIDDASNEILTRFPISDDQGEWESSEEAIGWRMKVFGTNFPPVNEDYMDSEQTANLVSRLAFAGMCCLYTRRVDSYSEYSLIGKHRNKENAVFVNDNTSLGSSSVRRGYERYGAAAYFNEDGDLVGIYTCHDSTYHPRPKHAIIKMMKTRKSFKTGSLLDPEFATWKHAMWVWRVSALALVTVSDHLLNLHLIEANALVSASRGNLPINHPLRAFLKIFTYRTISINAKAYKTLVPRNGVISRCWAFDNDSLQDLMFSIKPNFKKKLPDRIHESMRNEEIFPANEDMNGFWEVVREMVHDILCTFYDAPERITCGGNQTEDRRLQRNIDNDKDLQAFLAALASDLGLQKSRELSSFNDIVDVLSSLICSVTGMHELVGQISDYFAHPTINGTTLRPGLEIDSIQIYQLNCALVAATGMRMPRLLGNWDHLMTRNRFGDEAIVILRRFNENLRELSRKIEERNLTRTFVMEAFNPMNMESSVSV